MIEPGARQPAENSAAALWRKREARRGADIWRVSFFLLAAASVYLWATGTIERRDTLRGICEPVLAWYEREHGALDLSTQARFSEVVDRCLNSGVSLRLR